ncbi:MAG: hypothetical protein K2Q26_13555 [Bdellovibrionales bacterium]|nr:hypothetical protein [Bdellovibrionales bacterium]
MRHFGGPILDFKSPFQWEELGQRFKETHGFTSYVRVYQGVSHALMELSQGFKQLYSFKRQIHFHSGFGTHMDDMLIQLSSESVAISPFTSETVLDEKKTLFCVVDRDDAITTELYHKSIDNYFASKVNYIWVHHQLHKAQGMATTIKDTDIHIYSLGPQLAVAHIGKRLQSLHKGTGPSLDWSALQKMPSLSSVVENPQWVEAFEGKSIAGSQAFFTSPANRLFDRALLYWTDIESSALRDVLIRDHGVSPNHVDCLSLHRWNELRILAQFEKKGFTPEVFRGLLLFSSELSKDPKIDQKILAAHKSLQ